MDDPARPATGAEAAGSEAELQQWLRARIAEYVQLNADEVQPGTPLSRYGLDSIYALSLCGDIESELGIELDPALIWDHPTVDALTTALLDLQSAGS